MLTGRLIMDMSTTTTKKLKKGLLAFGVIAIIVINGLLAADLNRQHQAALSGAVNSASMITVGMEQYTARSLEAVDAVLEGLADRISRLHGPVALDHPDITELLANAFRGPLVGNIIVVNASGRYVNDAYGQPNPDSELADRDYFRTHQLLPDTGMFLDRPLIARTSGEQFVAASRALKDQDERFIGVVAAILNTKHYADIYADLEPAVAGSIALMDGRGPVVASIGAVPEGLDDALKKADRDQPEMRFRDQDSGREYLLVHQPIEGYPLTQVVTADIATVLAPWWQTVAAYSLLAILITSLLTIGLYLLWREMSRSQLVEDQLRESESRFRSLIESTSDFVWEMDENGFCVCASPQVEEMIGYTPDEVVGMRPYDPMTPREQDRLTDVYHSIIEAREPFHLLENRNVHRDGHEVVLETSGAPIFDAEGKFRGYRGIDRDITERKRLEEALRSLALLTGQESETEFFQLANRNLARALGMRVSVLVQNVGNGEHKLRAWHDEQVGGAAPPLPTTIIELLDEHERLVIREHLTEKSGSDPMVQAVQAQSLFAIMIQTASDNNWGYLIAMDALPVSRVRLSRVEPILDVFAARIALELDRNQAQADLSWEARHDTLTGLLNRRAFDDRLREVLSVAPTKGAVHALIYLDLDQFKVVNDTCGHMAGDELMRQLARALSSRLRRSDQLARLGGDEFGLILADCPMERSMEIAETLLDTVRNFQFRWEKHNFSVGASIGMTHTREAVSAGSDLLAQADLACYAAKDLGRNRIQVYQADNTLIRARHGEMGWVPRLDRALVENRFQLFGQWMVPISPESSLTPSLEVLLRLVDEDGKIIPAMEFIPAAERYNLMTRVDRHVIDQVFARAALTTDADRPRRWSINLSGTSLGNRDLSDFIEARFGQYGVDPSWFCFEITETAAISNFEEAQQLFSHLRKLGCRVGLDDFGSGLSSFAYLRQIEVDALKIDGSFVRGIAHDPVNRSMVQAMHDVAKAMSLDTVAEFVENTEILKILAEMGIDLAQGYALHKPQPLDALDSPPSHPLY